MKVMIKDLAGKVLSNVIGFCAFCEGGFSFLGGFWSKDMRWTVNVEVIKFNRVENNYEFLKILVKGSIDSWQFAFK